MNPDENITPDSLPQEGGEGAVGVNSGATPPVQPTEGQVEALSLQEINSYLGKNFTSKETALKAIKDTFGYVGKKAEPDEDLLRAKGYLTREQLENELFFRDNPQHAANKKILESIAKSDNVTLAKAAETPEYKKLFEGASEFEKTQSLKSVLNSNPRLAQVGEKTDAIKELVRNGNKEAAREQAAKTLIDALNLQ